MDFVKSNLTVHAVQPAVKLIVPFFFGGSRNKYWSVCLVEMMVVDRLGDDASIYMNFSVNARARNGRPNACVN